MHLVRRECCRAQDAFRPATVLWNLYLESYQQRLPVRQRAFSTNESSARPSASQESAVPREVLTGDQRHADNIDPSDLTATLEAHRAANVASTIHKRPADVPPESGPDFLRLEIKGADAGNGTEKVQPGNKPPFKHAKKKFSRPQNLTGLVRRNSSFVELMNQGRKANLPKSVRRRLDSPQVGGLGYLTAPTEYEGQIVFPWTETAVPEAQLPWVAGIDTEKMSPYDRLDAEIAAFAKYIRPNDAEDAARRFITQQLQKHVMEMVEGHKAEVFGSQRNGLYLATSDVDLRLYEQVDEASSDKKKAPRFQTRKQMLKQLATLLPKLQRTGHYLLCSLRYARYPLISLQHKSSGLDLQVVAANDTSMSRSYVQKYLEEYPGLQELYTVIKVIFDLRGLQDVFRGGFGSYSMFMMIVASLKMNPELQSASLGEKLMGFLSFWANFDTYKNGISIEPPELFPKGTRKFVTKSVQEKMDQLAEARRQIGIVDRGQPYLLCLQDPADALNDLGRKGYAIKHVQETLKALWMDLSTDLRINRSGSLLAPFVGGSYGAYEGGRAKLEDFGRQVLEKGLLDVEQKEPSEVAG